MGDVVSLHPGNGAKETLDRYFDTDAYGAYIAAGLSDRLLLPVMVGGSD